MQVLNISNLIHPATLNWAAKTSVGVLLKTWMAARTTWFVVFPHRESITSLNLLATLCLIQPRKLLAAFAARVHRQAMVNLVSPRDSRSFSDQLLFSQSALSLYQCMRFFSRCQTWHFLLFEIFLQPASPAVNDTINLYHKGLCTNDELSLRNSITANAVGGGGGEREKKIWNSLAEWHQE